MMSKNQYELLVASYVNGGNATYFDSFGVERILKKIQNLRARKISQQIL